MPTYEVHGANLRSTWCQPTRYMVPTYEVHGAALRILSFHDVEDLLAEPA